jgi:TolB-like protein/DNA-binding CsgD family transcriptional regulator
VLDGGSPSNLLAELSDRERAVATKFAGGMTYRQIGDVLFIAPTTVRTHLSAIYRKLGVRNKVALANLISAYRPLSATPADSTVRFDDDQGRPVILVLPFESLSADARWARLAGGLSAEIAVDLARFSDLAVIARRRAPSSMGASADGQYLQADYVLEGSLQAEGHRVRLCVRLADARKGVGLWASRYDRPVENLFSMQDRLTQNVISALAGRSGKLANLRRDAVRRKPPGDLRAYDYYLLGTEQNIIGNREANREAIRLLSRAVDLDPGLARAWSVLGDAYSVEVCNGFSSNPSRSIGLWGECLQRALALDPADGYGRLCMGDLRALRGDIDGAAEEQECTLAMAPNDADTLAMLAASRTLVTGDPGQAYELAKRAVRLNPYSSCNYAMLGRATFVVGRFEESLSALERAPAGSPTTLLFRAMAYAMLCAPRAAKEIADNLVRNVPGFSVNGFMRTYPVTNPPAIAAVREGARRAGLP